jgi:hypothetical protein
LLASSPSYPISNKCRFLLSSIHYSLFIPTFSFFIGPIFFFHRWGAKFDFGLPAVWAQFFVYEHGLRDHNNCARAPVACQMAAQLGSGGLVLGDAKYSLLAPGAQVEHICACVCICVFASEKAAEVRV